MSWMNRCRWLLLSSTILVGTAPSALADETPATESASDPAAAKAKADEEYYELYKTFADTIDQVERNYVKEISRRELMEAAIQGVISKLDQHSTYIKPEDLTSFKTSVEAQFGGIGIQITFEDKQLKVLSPLVGTPAYRAGLQAGDRIVKIEGETTAGITADEAVKRLKGEVGTSVTMTIVHEGESEEKTVTIQREIVRVETVLGDRRTDQDKWDFMLDTEKRIGYIRVTAFSRETANDIRQALNELKGRDLKGLVLDLRYNPGGLLTSAIEISDLFLTAGRIVSTKGRNVAERSWDAVEPGTFDGFPMAILVNRYSASASEIVSAALQDHDRAVVIGERTWGKGSVQNVIELDDHRSALKLTTASYQRPSGKNIHRFPDSKETDEWGVKPSDGYEIKLTDSEMSDLVQQRRLRDIVRPKKQVAESTEEKPADDDDEAVDRQLQKAVEYLTTEMAQAG